MKRTPLKRIGKIGRANLEANKLIKEQNPPQYCEMQLEGCLGKMYLQIAHKHKRSYYKGNIAALADKNEWVVACHNCHNLQEHNKELTKDIFDRLRS